MGISIHTGNIFDSRAHTLVNAVNCVGVMGAGLARQFKERYPGMYRRYATLCQNGNIFPGSVMFDDSDGQNIANVATKDDWRFPARLDWVVEGIKVLSQHVRDEEVPSVAIPPLGCGLGGLDYRNVLPTMVQHFYDLDCRAMLYVTQRHETMARNFVQEFFSDRR